MSEKRFVKLIDEMPYDLIKDNLEEDDPLKLDEIVDKMNEQQSIIEEQEKIIKKQRKEYINLKENTDTLRRTWAKQYKHKKRRVWNY